MGFVSKWLELAQQVTHAQSQNFQSQKLLILSKKALGYWAVDSSSSEDPLSY
jgi:hypothetical protein